MAKSSTRFALFEVASKSSATTGSRWSILNPLGWLRPRSVLRAPGRLATNPTMSHVAASPVKVAAVIEPAPAAPPPPPPVAPSASPVHDSAQGISVSVDPTSRAIALRFSYASASICGLAVVVLGLIAYLLGRQSGSPPRPVLAKESVPEIRSRPPVPGVLNLATMETSTGAHEETGAISPGGVAPPTSRPAAGVTGGGAPPAFVVDDPRRQVGLNYVVVQSYPSKEMADEIVTMLATNGISATTERGLKGWGQSWYCVVGTKGFARISAQEFRDYLAQLKSISDRNLSRRSFKAFAPQAYKWGQ